MIFPPHCKCIGYAGNKPVGDRVYFLSEYLIHEVPGGFEILAVKPADGDGLMRDIESVTQIAGPDDVYMYPEPVVLHNRGDLIKKALQTNKRCTIFTGIEEHMIFICDPDPASLLTVHVYDVTPPRPHLAGTVQTLDEAGIFGELEITLQYHVRDIRETQADVYPCKAGGFSRTIDSDRLKGDEHVAGCMTARQFSKTVMGMIFRSLISVRPMLSQKNLLSHDVVGQSEAGYRR
jgi:hypothetical protein